MQLRCNLANDQPLNWYRHYHDFRYYCQCRCLIDTFIVIHLIFFMLSLQVRVIAYTQFLESYKSVTLAAMAGAFGVSVDFLDR